MAVNCQDSEALRLLGGLYLQNSRWVEAADCLGKAVDLRPDDAETMANLGIALCNSRKKDAAVAPLSLKPQS